MSIHDGLATLLARGGDTIELDQAALEIARFVNPNLDAQGALARLDEWAAKLESALTPGAGGTEYVTKANRVLFAELGLTGDADTYHDPANSCLDQVLERRKGLPITLSVVYLEVARRLLRPAFGLGLPAHFLVWYNDGLFSVFVDPFRGGKLLTAGQCLQLAMQLARPATITCEEVFAPASKRQIAVRMLQNLESAYTRAGDRAAARRVGSFRKEHLPKGIPFNAL